MALGRGPIIDGDPPTRSTNVVIRTPDNPRKPLDRPACLFIHLSRRNKEVGCLTRSSIE